MSQKIGNNQNIPEETGENHENRVRISGLGIVI